MWKGLLESLLAWIAACKPITRNRALPPLVSAVVLLITYCNQESLVLPPGLETCWMSQPLLSNVRSWWSKYQHTKLFWWRFIGVFCSSKSWGGEHFLWLNKIPTSRHGRRSVGDGEGGAYTPTFRFGGNVPPPQLFSLKSGKYHVFLSSSNLHSFVSLRNRHRLVEIASGRVPPAPSPTDLHPCMI